MCYLESGDHTYFQKNVEPFRECLWDLQLISLKKNWKSSSVEMLGGIYQNQFNYYAKEIWGSRALLAKLSTRHEAVKREWRVPKSPHPFLLGSNSKHDPWGCMQGLCRHLLSCLGCFAAVKTFQILQLDSAFSCLTDPYGSCVSLLLQVLLPSSLYSSLH